jgi:hypothetical protein
MRIHHHGSGGQHRHATFDGLRGIDFDFWVSRSTVTAGASERNIRHWLQSWDHINFAA